MEMNASHEIALLNKREEATLDSKLYFRKKGVDYYPDLTIRKMTELLHRDYEYSILDFGVLTPHTRPEFLHCDKRIVLCNVSPWKTTQFDKFVHKLKKYKVPLEEVKFVNAYGDMIKKNQEQIYKQYGIRVEPAPLLCNPFQLLIEFRPEVYQALVVTFSDVPLPNTK